MAPSSAPALPPSNDSLDGYAHARPQAQRQPPLALTRCCQHAPMARRPRWALSRQRQTAPAAALCCQAEEGSKAKRWASALESLGAQQLVVGNALELRLEQDGALEQHLRRATTHATTPRHGQDPPRHNSRPTLIARRSHAPPACRWRRAAAAGVPTPLAARRALCAQRTCLYVSGPGASRLPRPPRRISMLITSPSRSGSMGGLVTCNTRTPRHTHSTTFGARPARFPSPSAPAAARKKKRRRQESEGEAACHGPRRERTHLRKALLEVVVERVRLVRQHGQRDVVAHAEGGLHAALRTDAITHATARRASGRTTFPFAHISVTR